ncbi:MAG: carbohydrate ABC transporter permease, partial [Anaerolineae bacterium]|nr:carbohydrate ABC transporter permease [Anaerolineae bacterium]
GVFSFTTGLEVFIFAMQLLDDTYHLHLSVGINFFVGQGGTVVWGNIMAMAVLIVVPALIIFLFLQRYMVAGLTAGAVKS